ncbi:MAG: OmpH family outer membrane protein [Chloroflexi bacterium]|nr:MAG: OmpH family outer membrane protein [Chloroflexota bacterium]
MRWPDSSVPSAPSLSVAEPYLPVEEVARRLDLPLAILLRRVEAGDVPARRIEGPEGVRYSLRLSDLGIEPDRAPSEPVVDLVPVDSPASAIAEAVKPQLVPPFPSPAQPSRPVPLRVERPAADAAEAIGAQGAEELGAVATQIRPGDGDDFEEPSDVDVVGVASRGAWPDKVVPPPAEELAAELAAEQQLQSSRPSPRAHISEAAAPATLPQAPARDPRVAILADPASEPHRDVAAMTLDPRELVAGLLDRWERTLESRIYAEQRQRFESELNARQNLVKQLQLELQTARAEHAAVQAERDRRLSERERQIADLQRELNDTRAAARRRHWLFGK